MNKEYFDREIVKRLERIEPAIAPEPLAAVPAKTMWPFREGDLKPLPTPPPKENKTK